jgi:hypothetical protein
LFVDFSHLAVFSLKALPISILQKRNSLRHEDNIMSIQQTSPGVLAISTSLALVEQFIENLAAGTTTATHPLATNAPSPLTLLTASTKSLRAQTTKVSLLAITSPFTASAVSASLKTINESVLPSLMTAVLLTTSQDYTPSFEKEVKGLARALLREFQSAIRLIDARSRDDDPSKELSKARQSEITEATGKVWEACDTLSQFSEEGLCGFVARKAKQWLDLMIDAVKELEDWDPEDDIGEDPFGDSIDEHGPATAATEDDITDDDRATISAGVKVQVLRVLSRIPQSVHVLLKQRVEKYRPPPTESIPAATRDKLEQILVGTRRISEFIDESAEGMYMGDPELCLKRAGEARALTIEIMQAGSQALHTNAHANVLIDPSQENQEDKFIKRAIIWIQQVDTSTTS